MSVPPAIASSSKAATTAGQLSPAQNQAGSVAAGDTFGQRRSGGSGSFGAGNTSRASPSPRNAQLVRKQHKGSKRFRATDEDALAESAAMRPFNNRKGQTSITHLMNFSLPPRPPNYHSHAPSRNNRRHPTWGMGSGYHAVDKARFVHSNYRFIVDPRGDYRAQNVDADTHLDWNNVLQILVSAQSQLASCPICLGTPVAPRMAKCGHIFCLPCLIRYMHADEEAKPPEKRARSKKCPLCWDSIYISETRPVRWYTGQEGGAPHEGEDIVLRLIMRTTGSTLALPRDGAELLDKDQDIPWYYAAEVMDYARVMKGSEDYLLSQLDEEVAELERQEKEDELMFGEDNVEWVRKAVRSIHEAKEKVKGIGNPPALPSKPAEQKPKRAPIVYHEAGDQAPEMYLIQNAIKSGQSISQATANESTVSEESDHRAGPATIVNESNAQFSRKLSTTSNPQKAGPGAPGTLAEFRNRQHHEHHNTPSEYYFYQALLHYYLSPLDIRILKAAFGNFSTFPSTILPRVERVSTGHIVDDELRRKTKYLAHLPYGCEVGFLECDWTDTVPSEILEQFKAEIDKRRKKNQDKEAREEKARIKAEKEEDARYAPARRKRASISERFTADDFQPLVSSDGADSSGSVGAESASTSPPWPARRGQGFASLASPSTSPSAARTVWGTTIVASSSPTLVAVPSESDMRDDGWLQGWEKDLLQEEDMIAQAQAMSLVGEGEPSKKPPASGGKKKKAKKITLMSTNVRRGA
ncbi:RING finger domain-containing protein [Lophium mytilinum]|uniref:RING finger domain-containing protein n=1 Tax=Lophium mytilinum TaxID=390894 RepID=A0A6A6REX0_9PEZI|nr:RING finger domain-containing protein [Lophium mytilinum]